MLTPKERQKLEAEEQHRAWAMAQRRKRIKKVRQESEDENAKRT